MPCWLTRYSGARARSACAWRSGRAAATIQGMVQRRAMELVLMGVPLGLAGAFAAGQLLSRMLSGVGPRTPGLLGGACVVVSLTAAVAAWLPARRASAIAPT